MHHDLHSHTHFSDGRLSPTELVNRALERRVTHLAITDHDSVSGLNEAQAAASGTELTVINGIEFSTCWKNKEIHIVGLWVDPSHPGLLALIDAQAERREARGEEIARRLEKARIPDALAGARRYAGEGTLTRAHFAQYLLELGKATSMQGVFKKYMTRGNPGYVPPPWPEMSQAIDAIAASGGVAVLAHPGRYSLSGKWLRQLISDFAAMGGGALEVAQCQQPQNERRFLADLAAEHQLAGSQGSDFHYPSPYAELGRNLYLPAGCRAVWEREPV
ncbi:RNase RNM [Gallaecimonas pentaromativorans]|uniref:RNase RNM n=1 Tax=Gallaecimonas pentaromativorans TaxID=584787 RepID=UPI00067EEAC2|nr:PHP domain-containing protein [Gallaecimonas pentaromativorans]MED5525808.1 PHP domain-containing protein [Pseudomonadota bacterium]